MSSFRKAIIPKVMAKVMGMERAISSAERHSQKPIRATKTTKTMASKRLLMNSETFSLTWSG